ncbi:MAG: GyrI-like domain-containing protein [Tumebacillaceae bacterium]
MTYRIEEVQSFSVVGKKERVRQSKNEIARLWGEANQNGLLQQLVDILAASETSGPRGVLGVCANGGHGTRDEFDYYVAAVSDHETPHGMEKLHFPTSTWAIFEVSDFHEIIEVWSRLYTEWIPASGYELVEVPAIECYFPPGSHPVAEIWVAVEKK